jgi:hypothetical protein
METKVFYTSKTFWLNVIGILHILFGKQLGIDFITPEMEATFLGLLNVILRFVTKKEITIS